MPRIKPCRLSLKLLPPSGTPGSGPGPPPTQLCKGLGLSFSIFIPSPLLSTPITAHQVHLQMFLKSTHFPQFLLHYHGPDHITWGTEEASLPVSLPPVCPLRLIHSPHHCKTDLATPAFKSAIPPNWP